MKIKITKRQITTFILASMLLTLNFGMRYGVWKKMQSYNQDKTRYEKLALAYHLSAEAGIVYELKILAKHDPTADEFVRVTSERLKNEKDVQKFMRTSMAEDRDKINKLKQNRFILSGIIYLVLAGQAWVNLQYWWKDNRHHFKKESKMDAL